MLEEVELHTIMGVCLFGQMNMSLQHPDTYDVIHLPLASFYSQQQRRTDVSGSPYVWCYVISYCSVLTCDIHYSPSEAAFYGSRYNYAAECELSAF